MSRISPSVSALVERLYAPAPLTGRIFATDDRDVILAALERSGEFRVIPALLPLLAGGGALSSSVARAIATLAEGIGPAQLAWLDEQARRDNDYWENAWSSLRPGDLSALVDQPDRNPLVIGVVCSHRNGHVRAAALEHLGQCHDGREIPFLALRANDWVGPVAERAAALLEQRLHPGNRAIVLSALPFIARTLAQQRRDHSSLASGLRSLLLIDDGRDAVAQAAKLSTRLRRVLFELLAPDVPTVHSPVLRAAIGDPDVVIRRRALMLIVDNNADEGVELVQQTLRRDRVPLMRKHALTLLAEHWPACLSEVFPRVLLDRAGSVREYARYLVRSRDLPVDPRATYLNALRGADDRERAAALMGMGEIGTRDDLDDITPSLHAPQPAMRAAALRTLGRLDAAHAVTTSLEALGDQAPSVQRAAVNVLARHSNRVDFEMVCRVLPTLQDPARRQVVRLLANAPKWDAAAYLLDALNDLDLGVRATAWRLIDAWIADFNRSQAQPSASQLRRIDASLDKVADRLRGETVKLLRFTLNTQ